MVTTRHGISDVSILACDSSFLGSYLAYGVVCISLAHTSVIVAVVDGVDRCSQSVAATNDESTNNDDKAATELVVGLSKLTIRKDETATRERK